MPSPAELKAAGRRELDALAALLAQAEPGHSVHGARRRIKQLRSLLRLLRPAMREADYDGISADLRQAADALAGHRRAEALVTAAGKLAPAKRGRSFWEGFAEAHRAAHAAVGNAGQAMAVARQAIAEAAGGLAAAALSVTADDAVAASCLATYAKARKRLRLGLKSGAAEDLHEARKLVIHHLHHLMLLHPQGERRISGLERLRETLGDLNDLDELEQLSAGAAIAEPDSRRMRAARDRLLVRAEKANARLFAEKPGQFAKRLGHAASHVPPAQGLR